MEPGRQARSGRAATPLTGLTYDERLASVYDRGQAMEAETLELWVERIRRHSGPVTPRSVLDLGCGTGVFCPALAEVFGSSVIGMEPSEHMRAVARSLRPHPSVAYVEGCAERIPLPDGFCDLVLMFLVLQHVSDRQAAADEIARVLRPGGRLLVAGRFRDEPTPRGWSKYFPSANLVEERSLPTIVETVHVLAAAGLHLAGAERVRFMVCRSLREYTERVRLRSVSAFEHLSDEDFEVGMAALESEAALETIPHPVEQEADLLVFERA